MKPLKKYIDLGMKFLTDRMPRKAAISAIVLAGVVILFVILLPVLGGADSQANEDNETLKSEIDRYSKDLKQAQGDRQFIADNHERYEELIHGDRLIPHTRRVAMAAMQKLALDRGLTTLAYKFGQSGDAAKAGPAVSGGYRVQAERIDLKVGAPLDTQIYDFVADLGDSFPGAAVVEMMSLERSSDMTTEALNQVSRGQESGLAKGQILFTWRTAQAVDDDKKGKK